MKNGSKGLLSAPCNEYILLYYFNTFSGVKIALSIRNPRAEKLVREIAAMSGENITQVIIHTLEKHIERLRGQNIYPDTVKEIMNISRSCSSIQELTEAHLMKF